MSDYRTNLRRAATVVATLSLAAIAAAPAGAWPVPDPAADGVRQGSMPTAEAQSYLAKRQPARTSTVRKTPKTRPSTRNCRRPAGVAKASAPTCRAQSLVKSGKAK